MTDSIQRLWRIPAFAIAANVILLLWLMTGGRRIAVITSTHLYEVMFWATPVIGIVVLCLVAWMKAMGPPHQRAGRVVWWSVLAVTEPAWLFVLQVLLSGCNR